MEVFWVLCFLLNLGCGNTKTGSNLISRCVTSSLTGRCKILGFKKLKVLLVVSTERAGIRDALCEKGKGCVNAHAYL